MGSEPGVGDRAVLHMMYTIQAALERLGPAPEGATTAAVDQFAAINISLLRSA